MSRNDKISPPRESAPRSREGASEVVWRDASGAPLDCDDKTAVLERSLAEIEEMAQDAFADGLLMGVDEVQLRDVFRALVGRLRNPWAKGGADSQDAKGTSDK